ncbi:MAG: sulfite exporter TauE/SafE family protein [Rhodocyclaceae bacterium]|jgi:uncharacterized membrane protein YfcA|nr:sulfite exporter TauE/SafE family protein [Rhodocyclaceae bacterium]
MDSIQLIPIALGLISGSILGLTGAGGAIIAVPALVFGLGLPLAQASPIALIAVAISAGIGASMGYRQGILRYKAALVMSTFGLCLSPAGIFLAQHIPNAPLTGIFSLVLLYVSINLFRQAHREMHGLLPDDASASPCMLDQTRGKLNWTLPCFKAMVFSGMLAGFMSGLLGVGGGFIIVPALKKFTDLPMNSIVTTSLGVMTIVALGSVAAVSLERELAWEIAWPFALGTVTGLLLLRRLGEKIRGPRLQQTFAVFAFGVALSMMLNAFHYF